MEGQLEWHTLAKSLQGELYLRSLHPEAFATHAAAFNASVESPDAKAVALPRCTQDVVNILRWARANNLTISVKAGGYATAGWSVRGQLIISLKLLDSISIEMPSPSGTGFDPPVRRSTHGETSPKVNGKRSASKAFRRESPGGSESSSEENRSSSDSLDGRTKTNTVSTQATSHASSRSNSSHTPSFSPTTSQQYKRARRDEANPIVIESVGVTRANAPVVVQPTAENTIVDQLERENQKSMQLDFQTSPGSLPTFPGTFKDASSSQSPPNAIQYAAPDEGRPRRENYLPVSEKDAPSTDVLPAAPPVTNSPTDLTGPTLPGPQRDNPQAKRRKRPPHARVTLGTGLHTAEIDAFTAQYGYHVPLGAFPVGSAVFSTGGFGFLSRVYGLSMDNVLEAELVTADGRLIHLLEKDTEAYNQLSEQEQVEQKELWWAFRGAGICLGLITKIVARAYPVTRVYAADMIFHFNPATAPKLLKHWRNCVRNASSRFYSACILTAGPDPSSHVIVINVCCLEKGSPFSDGSQFVDALASWPGEPALLKTTELRPFLEQQQSIVKVLSAENNVRWAVRSDLVSDLSDDCIEESCRRFLGMAEKSAWLFGTAGGEIATCSSDEESCFPTSVRKGIFQVAAIHQWRDSQADHVWAEAAYDWIAQVISPQTVGGPYPSFFETQEPLQRVIGSYGGQERWDKLMEIKKRYDPENVFRWTFIPQEQVEARDA